MSNWTCIVINNEDVHCWKVYRFECPEMEQYTNASGLSILFPRTAHQDRLNSYHTYRIS